jgi:hypothetical protein
MRVPCAAWEPLLDGELARAACAAITEISEALTQREWPVWLPRHLDELNAADLASVREAIAASLGSGWAGEELFHAYCARSSLGNPHAARRASELADRSATAISSVPMEPSLYGGFVGIAWVVEHLNRSPIDPAAEPEEDDRCAAIDQALLDHLRARPWSGPLDLIDGATGLGVYALERLPRPAARDMLEEVVSILVDAAETTAEGMTWATPDLLRDPGGASADARPTMPRLGPYNLGVAHGIPGILALFAEAYAAGIATERIRGMLSRAVPWLLAQRLEKGAGSSFAASSGLAEAYEPARLAWCYGDAGVAVVLLAVARRLRRADWEGQALEVARAAAARTFASSGVRDASLCHGAAGLGHLFHRLFRATGDTQFRDAAGLWFAEALDMRDPGAGIAGFVSSVPGAGASHLQIDDAGLLNGAAGIGLCLIAAISREEPEWDRLLLASVPPPQR